MVDGPGLAYHVYYRLLAYRPASLNALDGVPSYSEIGKGMIIFLDELRAYGLVMYRFPHSVKVFILGLTIRCRWNVFFDGYLPEHKRPTRLTRLESSLKELTKFQSLQSNGLRSSKSTTSSPSVNPSQLFDSSRVVPPLLRGVPAPPFLVPAVLDALASSEYASITEVVPGEADGFCAKAAKALGAVILTGDSDMLVYDLGSTGSVAFFNQMEIKPPARENDSCSVIRARIFQPHDVARRLKVSNLQRLAFEIKQDPTLRFSEALGRARRGVLDQDLTYRAFLEEYLTERAEDGVTASYTTRAEGTHLPFLDPRLSELVLQLRSPSLREPPNVYLPFLLDDPSRSSAWVASAEIRYFKYSLLALLTPSPKSSIIEVSRKGFRILPQNISTSTTHFLPFPSFLLSPLSSLPMFPRDLYWRLLALRLIFTHATRTGKRPPSDGCIIRTITARYPQTKTWDDVHLQAEVQGMLYSLRMLKQSLGVLRTEARKVDVGIEEVERWLEELPGLDSMEMGIESGEKEIGLQQCLRFVKGECGWEGFVLPQEEASEERKMLIMTPEMVAEKTNTEEKGFQVQGKKKKKMKKNEEKSKGKPTSKSETLPSTNRYSSLITD